MGYIACYLTLSVHFLFFPKKLKRCLIATIYLIRNWFLRVITLRFFTMSEELSKKLLGVLACPKCKGSLKYEKAKSRLICKKCRLAYRVEGGIPIMLVEEAENLK